ncbi:MAG: hypothetical protein H6Q64_2471, partial [Firmicutes bacterium]|nr:hypothetical protein [Bacillota bacterium]
IAWLSLGETTTGRIFELDHKKWTNPYNCNRWALFTIMLIILMIQGNTFDAITTGNLPSFSIALGRVITILILIAVLVLAGKGKILTMIISFATFIYMGWGVSKINDATLSETGVVLYNSIAVLILLTVIYYYIRLKRSHPVDISA